MIVSLVGRAFCKHSLSWLAWHRIRNKARHAPTRTHAHTHTHTSQTVRQPPAVSLCGRIEYAAGPSRARGETVPVPVPCPYPCPCTACGEPVPVLVRAQAVPALSFFAMYNGRSRIPAERAFLLPSPSPTPSPRHPRHHTRLSSTAPLTVSSSRLRRNHLSYCS